MADLKTILKSGEITSIRLNHNTALNEVVEVKDVIKSMRNPNGDDYIPIDIAGNKPTRAEIEQALTDIGITTPASGQAIFKDINSAKTYIIFYIEALDQFRYEKLTKAH